MTPRLYHHAREAQEEVRAPAQIQRPPLSFCPHCGAELTSRSAFGRTRRYCPGCEHIIFRQHKIAAGMFLTDDVGRILLVKRALNPHRGAWTLPAGFVEYDEAPAAAAIRETWEETGLDVKIDGILDVIAGREHPHGADIIIVYRGRITGGNLAAGDDATAARFFAPDALPPTAFRATAEVIDRWRATLKAEKAEKAEQ